MVLEIGFLVFSQNEKTFHRNPWEGFQGDWQGGRKKQDAKQRQPESRTQSFQVSQVDSLSKEWTRH